MDYAVRFCYHLLMRERFLKQLVAVIFAIAVLHIAAIGFHFYWSIWWYDILLHFFGGVWIGIFSLWFVFYSRYIKIKELEKAGALGISAIAVMFAFGVGMIWELYEFMLSANFSREGYAMDTLIDLIMDVSGALVGYVIFTLQRERYIHGR